MDNRFLGRDTHVGGNDRTVPMSSFNPSVSPTSEPRYGMSNNIWGITLTVTETLLDIIKAVMVVGGILAANLADVIFGAVGITILFGGTSALFNGTPVWLIGTILSMGASAIQIYLWSLIQKRGITISQLFNWKKIPTDTRGFLGMAFLVWFIDTLIDMSPVALLVQNSQYETIQPLYIAMVTSVSILVFILCGFSEIMTSNMRGMLMATASKPRETHKVTPKPTYSQKSFGGSKSQKRNGSTDLKEFMRLSSETKQQKLKD
jgi:hypothetical protein